MKKRVIYQKGTESIRVYPENYCLAFKDDFSNDFVMAYHIKTKYDEKLKSILSKTNDPNEIVKKMNKILPNEKLKYDKSADLFI